MSSLLKEERAVYAARFGGLQSKTLSPFPIACSGRNISSNSTLIRWRELMANIPPPPHESEGFLSEADASCSVAESFFRTPTVDLWHRDDTPARPPFHLTSSLFRPRFTRPYESLHLFHGKVCEPRRKYALFGGYCRVYSKRKEQYTRRGSAACRARRFRPFR